VKYGVTLLTHVGEEQAVASAEDQAYGNPLLFRRPLEMGVKVVMAHCGSLGENEDLDNPGETAKSFDLFLRLMDNPRYDGLLFGDISAMTQFNRLPGPLTALIKRPDLHHRLLDGSDYPLPAINIVVQTRALVKHGFISRQERKHLNEIYHCNPLLFDYVLKRTIRAPGTRERLSADVFQANTALEAGASAG
jgi:mannonate dehydratase